jgi:hypothetical protein
LRFFHPLFNFFPLHKHIIALALKLLLVLDLGGLELGNKTGDVMQRFVKFGIECNTRNAMFSQLGQGLRFTIF